MPGVDHLVLPQFGGWVGEHGFEFRQPWYHDELTFARKGMNESTKPLVSVMPGTPFTPVKELVHGSKAVADHFTYKDGVVGGGDPVPEVDIPVIDVSLLLSSSPAAGEELEKFRAAVTSWGCFQAINHGMSSTFLESLREIARGFFDLPPEEKLGYSRAPNSIEGFFTDKHYYDDQVLDWNERLFLCIYPEDQRKAELWPKKPQRFREVLHECSTKLSVAMDVIFRAMALSLKLPENSFIDQLGEPRTMHAGLNYFPPCPRPDLVLGFKPHSDASALTFVLPDMEVQGLQFLTENKWVKLSIIPEAFVVNVGDLTEIMSNGIIKSPIHRVVTDAESDRTSIAVFCGRSTHKEIGPIDELIGDKMPRLYKNVTNYGLTYFEYYNLGMRPIDSAKI